MSSGPSRAASRAAQRGFTLVEMLATIVIIALLAALATPSFTAMMRDRRVVRAGLILADTYREARSRALSRGNAVMVRWRSTSGGKGTIETRESIIAPAGQGTVTGCVNSDWAVGSLDTRAVSGLNFTGTTYELAALKLLTEGGAEAVHGEICFSPHGQTFARYVDGGTWASLTGVPRYEVTNTSTNVIRLVFVPPNGVARLQL